MRRFASTSRPTRAAARHRPSASSAVISGGIRHYEGAEAVNTKHYSSVTDSLRVFVDDPLVAPPGEQFHYSSYGFNLLGAAVETTTSSRFGPAVNAALLRPLGMKRTSVGRPPTGGTRFYEVTERRRAVAAPYIDLSDRYPSGGFLSTAEDLVRLGIGVTNPAFLDDQFADAPLHIPTDAGRGADGLRVRLRGRREPRRTGRGTHGQRRGRHGRPPHSPEDACRRRPGHERGVRNRAAPTRPVRDAGAAAAGDAVHPPRPAAIRAAGLTRLLAQRRISPKGLATCSGCRRRPGRPSASHRNSSRASSRLRRRAARSRGARAPLACRLLPA